MSRPTIIQSILGRPSQSYSFPSEKDYYSAKAHFSRVALGPTLAESTSSPAPSSRLPVPADNDENEASERNSTSSSSDKDTDIFYTPPTSPRNSAAFVSSGEQLASASSSTCGDTNSLFSVPSSPSSATSISASSRRSKNRRRRNDLDQSWAKDVRWLDGTRTTTTSSSSSSSSSSSVSSKKSLPNPPPSTKPRTRSASSKGRPTIMMSMMALLEEDETKDLPTKYTPNNFNHNTNGRIATPSGRRHTTSAHGLQRRKSRSLEDLASTTSSLISSSSQLPSQGTAGFTSLTLPRAPPRTYLNASSSSHGHGKLPGSNLRMSTTISVDGTVDLTRSGIAQTTMASIEVVRGLSSSGSTSKGKGKALGLFGSLRRADSLRKRRTDSSTNFQDESSGSGNDILGFTSYRKPPSYVPGPCVLVQVWGVGLDMVDSLLLQSNTATVGYVPGRSFVGRALELGWDVREDVVRKGEWVVGLLSTQASGALQEFIVVDRHRLHRVPHPNHSVTIEQLALIPLCGVVAYRAINAVHHIQQGRVLVLGGEEGVGWMATQMLQKRGWNVSMTPGPDKFDAVIDTVGGKDIWELACARYLVPAGQFVTTKGDKPSRPIPSSKDLFRGGLRSLSVKYVWVCGDVDFSGEDIRTTLGRVLMEGVLPLVSQRVVFERADRKIGMLNQSLVVRVAE